jgi:predicted ATPase
VLVQQLPQRGFFSVVEAEKGVIEKADKLGGTVLADRLPPMEWRRARVASRC